MAAKTWFKESIASLLSAPGPLHMPKLPHGIGGGHGPIDVFSTRFANLFADDVDATVDGERLDKAALKDRIVAIKKEYNPSTASFSDIHGSYGDGDFADGERVQTRLDWTQSSTDGVAEFTMRNTITWDARVKTISGDFRKIYKLGITTQ